MENRIQVIIPVAALLLLIIILFFLIIMPDRKSGHSGLIFEEGKPCHSEDRGGADIYDTHDPFGPWRKSR